MNVDAEVPFTYSESVDPFLTKAKWYQIFNVEKLLTNQLVPLVPDLKLGPVEVMYKSHPVTLFGVRMSNIACVTLLARGYTQHSSVKSPAPIANAALDATLSDWLVPLNTAAPDAMVTSSNVPAYAVFAVVLNFAGAMEVFSSKFPLTKSVPVLVSLVAMAILQEHRV